VIGAKGDVWTQEAYEEIKEKIAGKTKILINFNNTFTQSPYSLYLALRKCKKEDVLAIDGDLIFSRKALLTLLESKKSSLLTKKTNDPSEVGNRVLVMKGKVQAVGKHLIPTPPFYIYSGMMKIVRSDVFYLKELLQQYSGKDMGYVLNDLCKKTEILNCPNSEWVNINTKEDYRRALECIASW
jgi:choline kinase